MNMGILFEVMDREAAAATVLEMLDGAVHRADRDVLVDLGGFSAPSMFRGDSSLRLLPEWRLETSYATGALRTLQQAGLSAAVPASTEMMLSAATYLRAGTPPSSLLAAALYADGDPAESPYTGQASLPLRVGGLAAGQWEIRGGPGTAALSRLPVGGFEPAATADDSEPSADRAGAWARISHGGHPVVEVEAASLQSIWPAVMHTSLDAPEVPALAPVSYPPATGARVFAALQPRFATELPPVTFQFRQPQLRLYQQYIRHVEVPAELRPPGMAAEEAWAEVSWVMVRVLPNDEEERAMAVISVERAPLAARYSRQPLLLEAELHRHSDTGAYTVKLRQGPSFVGGTFDAAFMDALTQGQRLSPQAFLDAISALGSARQYLMPIYVGMILLDEAIAAESDAEAEEQASLRDQLP